MSYLESSSTSRGTALGGEAQIKHQAECAQQERQNPLRGCDQAASTYGDATASGSLVGAAQGCCVGAEQSIKVPFPHGALDALRDRRDAAHRQLAGLQFAAESHLQALRSIMNERDQLTKEVGDLDAGISKLHR